MWGNLANFWHGLTLLVLSFWVHSGTEEEGRNQPYGHKIAIIAAQRAPLGKVTEEHEVYRKFWEKNLRRPLGRRNGRRLKV